MFAFQSIDERHNRDDKLFSVNEIDTFIFNCFDSLSLERHSDSAFLFFFFTLYYCYKEAGEAHGYAYSCDTINRLHTEMVYDFNVYNCTYNAVYAVLCAVQ